MLGVWDIERVVMGASKISNGERNKRKWQTSVYWSEMETELGGKRKTANRKFRCSDYAFPDDTSPKCFISVFYIL